MSVKELLEKVLNEEKKPTKKMKKSEKTTVTTEPEVVTEAIVDDMAHANLPAKQNDTDNQDGYQHTPEAPADTSGARSGVDGTEDDVVDPADIDGYQAARAKAGTDEQPELIAPKITAESLSTDGDLAAIFKGMDLSDEFKSKVKNVYEASILTAANKVLESAFQVVVEAAEESIEEERLAIYEDLETKLDEYLSYIAEEWKKENEVANESIIRSQITENFIKALKSLLIEHSIDIPEDKIDVVNALTERNEELTESNDKALAELMEVRTELGKVKREYIVEMISEGLSDMEKDKLTKLSESVDISDEEAFVSKLVEIKQAYFTTEEVVNSVEKDDGEALVNITEEKKPDTKEMNLDVQVITETLKRVMKS
jgi:hypothetical protein